ncbi:hypothetical protein Q1M63_13450 (plasmid) [Sinorhizobium meliloti]|nr:hypothetical protein Q1M63_13450 [Sinorhizobium meliloti]
MIGKETGHGRRAKDEEADESGVTEHQLLQRLMTRLGRQQAKEALVAGWRRHYTPNGMLQPWNKVARDALPCRRALCGTGRQPV